MSDLQMKEAAVMERLGVPSRTTMRKLRAELLTEGTHWHRGQNDMVIYTAEGEAKLAVALHQPLNAEKNGAPAQPPQELSAEKKPAGDPAALASGASARFGDGTIEVIVTRWRFTNTNILEAKTDAGEILKVRVHDNTKFREGMKFKCQHTRPGYAQIVGRGPRYIGRM